MGCVKFLCLDGNRGYAIVKDSKYYEVDFVYGQGKISDLTCSCYCGYTCKHEVAAMLQLKDTLEKIEKNYAELHQDYFAAIVKGDLFRFAIDSKEIGSFTL